MDRRSPLPFQRRGPRRGDVERVLASAPRSRLRIAIAAILGLGLVTPIAARLAPIATRAQEEREPPPFELKVHGQSVQRAGIGTFCWIWGCVRKIGILTAARPHGFAGELDAVLDLDYPEAPSGLSATLYPVDPAVDLTELEEGMVAWRPSRPGTVLPLSAVLEQPLRLGPEAGAYLLAIGAVWSGESARDAIYGFYLHAEGGPDTSPSPTVMPPATAPTPEPPPSATPSPSIVPGSTEVPATASPPARLRLHLPSLRRP